MKDLINQIANNLVIAEVMIVAIMVLAFFIIRKITFTIMRFVNKKGSSFVRKIDVPVSALLVAAASIFILEVTNAPNEVVEFARKIFRTTVIALFIWAGCYISGYVGPLLKKTAQETGTKVDEVIIHLLSKILKISVVAIGVIVIIQEWKYDVTGLIAGLGVSGIIVALAGKDAATSLFSSVMIMLDKPFVVGDWITTARADGIVEEIGFRSTKIRTFDRALVSIPNTVLSSDAITNWSKAEKRRITLKVIVAHNTSAEDMVKFIEKVKAMLHTNQDIYKENIQAYLEKISELGIEVIVQFFTASTDGDVVARVRNHVNLGILEIMNSANIKLFFGGISIHS